MSCDKCDQPTTRHITEASYYRCEKEHHLCEDHARELLAQPPSPAAQVRPSPPRDGDVLLDVARLLISENHDEQVVFFRAVGSELTFPLVIGLFEATSIDRRLKGIPSPRPLTHDALAGTITALGGTLQDVMICDLKDHTYYASLRIRQGTEAVVEVDVRPSDAVCMAVVCGVPILIPERILNEVCQE